MSHRIPSRRIPAFVLPCFVVVLALATAFVARADAPRRPAPAPRQPAAPVVPQVTVVKVDGTTVRGQLTASDPDSVTVTPPAKAGSADAPEPVVVSWKDVRSVSNGFTQAKALVQWKQAHHDQLCETCHGDRTVLCPTCKGTAHDPAASKDCPTCHGELLVDCKGPRCDHGKVPCPNHCLQLTEGRWITKEDGLKWRTFPLGRGYFSFSEHHLGHMITIDRKAGTVTDTGVCPVCNGVTKVDCPVCHGQGKTPCPTCVARKDAPACPAHCDQGHTKCPTCDGTGLKKV